MKNKKYIVGGIAILVVIAIVVVLIFKKNGAYLGENPALDTQAVSKAEPVDIVLDFYNPWLDASKSTTTNPYKSELQNNPLLSSQLREYLTSTQGRLETDIDPVLCQTTRPEKVTARVVSSGVDEARILVMAKDKTLTPQSVFTLKRLTEGWYIDSISCSPGEFEAPREFTFDKEGNLLKKNIPPPYNPEYWHLVFAEAGKNGYVAPLFFSAETVCISAEGVTAVCTPDQFEQTSKVHVYGQMTELGVEVKKMEFVK